MLYLLVIVTSRQFSLRLGLLGHEMHPTTALTFLWVFSFVASFDYCYLSLQNTMCKYRVSKISFLITSMRIRSTLLIT